MQSHNRTQIMPAKTHVVMLLATLTLAALSSGSLAQAPSQQQGAPEILEYKGIVTAAREAEVAPRLDGLLSKINFTAGQVVNKGDLLFEFASKSNELSLALAQATLKQAEAQLALAEVNLKNKQTLRPGTSDPKWSCWKCKHSAKSRRQRLKKLGPTRPSPRLLFSKRNSTRQFPASLAAP